MIKANWVKYKNGNYNVILNLNDGTKIRETIDPEATAFIPETIESFDCKITNSCDMGCQMCLKPSAKLNMEEGTKKISNIQIGDKVWSVNINNNEAQLKQVVKLYEREYSGELISIETESGEIITLTPNHKIYTKNRGYVRADKINNDDVLIMC